MYAVEFGHQDVVQTFIDSFLRNGTDANLLRQRNNKGKTALEIAKEEGKYDCVHLLTNFVTNYRHHETLLTNFEDWGKKRATWGSVDTLDGLAVDSIAPSEEKIDAPPPRVIRSRTGKKITVNQDVPTSSFSDDDTTFDNSLIKQIENVKPSYKPRNQSSEKMQELWKQETMSWFSNERESGGSSNHDSGEEMHVDEMNENSQSSHRKGDLIQGNNNKPDVNGHPNLDTPATLGKTDIQNGFIKMNGDGKRSRNAHRNYNSDIKNKKNSISYSNGESMNGNKHANGVPHTCSKSREESDNCLRLPPIKGNRLIDYKTWCEMGENGSQLSRKSSLSTNNINENSS